MIRDFGISSILIQWCSRYKNIVISKNHTVTVIYFIQQWFWNVSRFSLEVLAQLANTKIARPNVMILVQTQDLTIVCEFNFSGLPLHLRPKKKDSSTEIKIYITWESIILKFKQSNIFYTKKSKQTSNHSYSVSH